MFLFKRKKLTNAEYDAIGHLTTTTHLDAIFDIWKKSDIEDCFINYETGERVSLKTGLKWLYSSLTYPLARDGLDRREAHLIVNLFKEYKCTKDDPTWLLSRKSIKQPQG